MKSIRIWTATIVAACILLVLGCRNTSFLGVERLWKSDKEIQEQAMNAESAKAIDLVKEQKVVKESPAELHFAAEGEGPHKWLVHVYEDKPGSIATVNWYHVDLEKNVVTPEF